MECAAAGAALPILQQAPGVIDVTIFGDRLHLLLHGADAAAGLQPFLARHGIECRPPRPITPSLEDVFVQLVTRPPA